MDCKWLRVNNSISKAVHLINTIDNVKFEQFLLRIMNKINLTSEDIFNKEEFLKLQKLFNVEAAEIVLLVKTSQYILRRLLKFMFKPTYLKNDLKMIGFNDEKSDILIKIWCSQSKDMIDSIVSTTNAKESLDIKWNVKAELSSHICKKAKVVKAELNITDNVESAHVELTHEELYRLFLNLEAIQNELDNIL